MSRLPGSKPCVDKKFEHQYFYTLFYQLKTDFIYFKLYKLYIYIYIYIYSMLNPVFRFCYVHIHIVCILFELVHL